MLKTAKRVPVRFYETKAGNVPVLDSLRAMIPEDRRIVGADLNAVGVRLADRHADVQAPG